MRVVIERREEEFVCERHHLGVLDEVSSSSVVQDVTHESPTRHDVDRTLGKFDTVWRRLPARRRPVEDSGSHVV